MASFSSTQTTVTATPALVLTSDTDGCRVVFHVDTGGSHTLYLGGETVSSTTGFALHGGLAIEVALPPNTKVYACTEAGTETLFCMIVGNN